MRDRPDLCEGEGQLTPQDRQLLLGRIHSALFWLGERIPQEMEVDGEMVPLRDVVFNYLTKGCPSEGERRAAMELADRLGRRAEELEKDLATEDLTVRQGCALMNEVRTLLRAADELRSSPEREERTEAECRLESERRWQKFLKQLK